MTKILSIFAGDDFEVLLRPESEAETRRVAANRREHRPPLQGDQGVVPEHEGPRSEGEEEAGKERLILGASPTSAPATGPLHQI